MAKSLSRCAPRLEHPHLHRDRAPRDWNPHLHRDRAPRDWNTHICTGTAQGLPEMHEDGTDADTDAQKEKLKEVRAEG